MKETENDYFWNSTESVSHFNGFNTFNFVHFFRYGQKSVNLFWVLLCGRTVQSEQFFIFSIGNYLYFYNYFYIFISSLRPTHFLRWMCERLLSLPNSVPAYRESVFSNLRGQNVQLFEDVLQYLKNVSEVQVLKVFFYFLPFRLYVIPLGVITGSFSRSKLILSHKKSGTSRFFRRSSKDLKISFTCEIRFSESFSTS